MGGVFNAVNMDVYHYAGNNPVKLVDPDGEKVYGYSIVIGGAGVIGAKAQGMLLFDDVKYDVYVTSSINPTIGVSAGVSQNIFVATCDTVNDFINQDWISVEGSVYIFGGELGISNSKNGGIDFLFSVGFGKSAPKFFGIMFNFYSESININGDLKKIANKKEVLNILNSLLDNDNVDTDVVKKAIEFWEKKNE